MPHAARPAMNTPALTRLGLATTAALCLVGGPLAHAGVLLGGERIGVNFNNRYAVGETKTDWLGLNYDVNDASVTDTIADLNMVLAEPIGNYRIGFSRPMAADPADLSQWLDTVEEVINGGNKVMVAGWLEGDINDATGDAVLWGNVVDAIQQRGLMHGISGFEIQNEPAASASGWRDYVRQVWKKVGPYGNQGWNALDAQERAETAAAWYDKPIVVQGTSFGQQFSSTLVNGLDGLPNLVWSAHDYSRFSADITTERETWTVEQWTTYYIDKWTGRQSELNGNLIVTELGLNNSLDVTLTGMGPAGTTANNRRDAGFAVAAEQYYGDDTDTTVFWYTAYNPASIGIGTNFESSWNIYNLDAVNAILFDGQWDIPAPEGTTNVALGKLALGSSVSGGNAASNAIDGERKDTNSRWLSDSGGDHWIEVRLLDFFAVEEMRFYNGFNDYESAPSDFTFQVWDPGQLAWVDVITEVGNNNPAYRMAFDPVVTNRVRLYVTDGLDDRVRLFELEVFGADPFAGDFNLDGVVDLLDFDILAQNFGATSGVAWAQGDANFDGVIDLLDFDILAQSFGGSAPANVPEPASALALAIAAPLLRRRRR